MASSGTHRLDGKVALVTGGSRGIGRAIAAAYARAGARVYICGRNQDDVGTAVRELQASGGEVDGETADVGSVEEVKRVVRGAARRFGTIDVLVNNASIVGPRVTIAEYPDPAWQEVLRINLSGVFFLCREVLPLMLAKRFGSIINVTSGVGRKGTDPSRETWKTASAATLHTRSATRCRCRLLEPTTYRRPRETH